MQRVVRSSLIGLLAMAGLTACGDKVTVPGVTTELPSAVVRSVTVTPASATLNSGDKITLVASVNADAGVTDRTVTWSSANTAIASVDANGVVTAGTTAGTTSITAASKADPNVKGAALITVNGGGANGAPATVTIANVNQTVCGAGGCNSVPANLANVAGQIDVTLNVDPGQQRLVGVDLILNCTGNGNSGTDTVVATQSLASANVVDASAASAPITLSFNTASFNSTSGAVAFRNGACTIKARARTNSTAGGAISTVTSTSQNITLNNTDVVVGTMTPAKSAINPVTGLVWGGGANVTVTATPVMYSGRVPGTVTVTFEGKTATSTTPVGTSTIVFNNGFGASGVTNDITGKTDAAAAPTFALIDATGNAFTTNPCGGATLCTAASALAGAPAAIPTMRLDTQKPAPGNLALNPGNTQQNTATSWVGAGFKFSADSASGYAGPDSTAAAAGCLNGSSRTCNLDNGGVDSVKVVFTFNTTGKATAGTVVTTGSALSETVANTTNTLVGITSDALGNADTSFASTAAGTRSAAASAFGVDKTAPANTQTGTANQATAQAIGGTGNIVATITDALSGPAANQLVAQVIQNPSVTTTGQPANQTVFTIAAPGTAATGCIVGRFNRTSGAANADTLALPVFDKTGAQVGTCSPTPVPLGGGTTVSANVAGKTGYVTTRIVAVDQAGNRAAPTTIAVAEDPTAPTVGALDLPTSATGGAALTVPAQVFDSLDVVASAIQLTYNGTANVYQFPQAAGPGTAFDNVLTPGSVTTASTASASIALFPRNLQTAPLAARPATPTQAANGPLNITVGAINAVNKTGTATVPNFTSTTSVSQPTSNPWAADFLNGFGISVNNPVISNCPTAGCTGGAAPANPSSTTVTVTAAGTTGTFANPFTTVQVWYQVNGAGPYFFAGNTGAGTSRDTGVGGNRFWDYTLTFTPAKTAPRDVATGNAASLTVNGTVLTVIGIGLNANGDALVTVNPAPVNITNP